MYFIVLLYCATVGRLRKVLLRAIQIHYKLFSYSHLTPVDSDIQIFFCIYKNIKK